MTPSNFLHSRSSFESIRKQAKKLVRRFDAGEEPMVAAGRELLVAIADMTGNRVWQMLARRLRTLLASEQLQETRRRIRRDHGRVAAFVGDCIEHHKAGRDEKALAALRHALDALGQGFNDHAQIRPATGKR